MLSRSAGSGTKAAVFRGREQKISRTLERKVEKLEGRLDRLQEENLALKRTINLKERKASELAKELTKE